MICALSAVAIAAILLLFFYRRTARLENAAEIDLAVYKTQLREIERDVARGTLPASEAENLRTEISRRILDAHKRIAPSQAEDKRPSLVSALVFFVVALGILGAMGGLYSRFGTHTYPDLPLKLRLSEAKRIKDSRPSQEEYLAQNPAAPPSSDITQDYMDLVKRLEAAVAERPNDPQGLRLLAQSQARLGQWDAAIDAQKTVLSLGEEGQNAETYAQYAELLIEQANGYVSPEAETALVAALQRDRSNKLALYYSGLLYYQTARPDQTFKIWAPLLEQSADEDPWVPVLRANLMDLAQWAGEADYELPEELRGPTQEDIDAASDMSAEDQAAFIAGMIEQLSERLATEGGSAAEWARLITSLGRTNQLERADKVYREAQERFAGRAADMAEIENAAKTIGLAP